MPAGRSAKGFLLVNFFKEKGGEPGMKKTMNASVLVKEAALWEKMKEAIQKRPATVCHK